MTNKKQVKVHTHAELVVIAHLWVVKNGSCGVAYKEQYSANKEIPDVIGFGAWHSVLIECKATRKDFMSDKRKKCRQTKGMGQYRYYCCPTGLIKVEELPEKWGLIYINEKGRATTVHAPFGFGNIRNAGVGFDRDYPAEFRLLYAATRKKIEASERPYQLMEAAIK